VLEISSPNINGGVFTDITDPAVGGSFITGGYNGLITNQFSPLVGRKVWGQTSAGYITTVVKLGPNVVNQITRLRFRMCSLGGIFMPGLGWRIDTLSVGTPVCGVVD